MLKSMDLYEEFTLGGVWYRLETRKMQSSKPRIQTCLYRGVELMAIKNQTLSLPPEDELHSLQLQRSVEEQHKQMMMALLNGDYTPGESLNLPEAPFAEEFSSDSLCYPNEDELLSLSLESSIELDSLEELSIDLIRKDRFQPLLKETPTTLSDFQEYLNHLELLEEETLQKPDEQLRNKWLRSMISGKPEEARELLKASPEAFVEEHNWCFTVVDIDEELESEEWLEETNKELE